ncbi:hypothetical protein PROFUN_00438 [Planoprotostelium fungivorum]|uniref:Oxysterol-binding protein n=1 Tax=Planoprotostelium fungivorum TaxID=1890364 RepID=A0A2P6N0T3_9EUKA|nr:hypothetical protein PROFUN_00438 [Planoprotostelium fungivorum]
MYDRLRSMFTSSHERLHPDQHGPEYDAYREADTTKEEDHYQKDHLEEGKKQILWAIIKQISIGSEIKHIQLPTFVIQPRSLLEKLSDSFVHPELLYRITQLNTPEERFIQALQFFMSGWHLRHKGVKNPLNPAIGEIFKCGMQLDSNSFDLSTGDVDTDATITPPKIPNISHDDSNYYYVAEQVSHHPPRSAFCFYNASKGIIYNGDVSPGYVKFRGSSADTQLQAHMSLRVFSDSFGEEEYEFTLPGVLIRGILYGTLTLEMVGKSMIYCKKTGFRAIIDFQAKGVFTGSYNHVCGSVWNENYHHEEPSHMIEGHWDTTTFITDKRSGNRSVLFDVQQHPTTRITTEGIDKQMPHESKRYWERVIEGIEERSDEKALGEKRRLEETQRRLEAERKKNREPFRSALFDYNRKEDKWMYKMEEKIVEAIQTREAVDGPPRSQ